MIKLQKNLILTLSIMASSILFFTQCAKDDDMKSGGQVTFEMTDAPIDNAEVQGAFVTVAALKVDGETIDLNGKQTIDLLAYQNGDTKSLGTGELEAGTYSNVTLVLDYTEDQDGNSPGCYVLTDDNQKHDLNVNGSNSNEISFNMSNLNVEENSQSSLVVDFDLRKAIKEQQGSTESNYSFVTDTELRAALRSSIKAQSGVISGNCSNSSDHADRVVAYVYKKGEYSASTEMEGQGSSNVEFSNAVSSSIVDSNGDFSLHFLEEGEYEVHLAGYNDNNGKLELAGSIQTSVVGSVILDLLSLNVEANATLSLNVTATGIIPL